MLNRIAHLAIAATTLLSIPAISTEAAQATEQRKPNATASARAPFGTSKTIYIFPARDNGLGSQVGIATVVNCSNVSGGPVTVRFLAISLGGTVAADKSIVIPHGTTRTASSHDTAAYVEDLHLLTGALNPGTINVESTDSATFCSAEVISAAAAFPDGVARHGVRVNPLPGTLE